MRKVGGRWPWTCVGGAVSDEDGGWKMAKEVCGSGRIWNGLIRSELIRIELIRSGPIWRNNGGSPNL